MTARIGRKIWEGRKPWSDMLKQVHWNWQAWLDITEMRIWLKVSLIFTLKIKNICENWEKENIFDILYLNIWVIKSHFKNLKNVTCALSMYVSQKQEPMRLEQLFPYFLFHVHYLYHCKTAENWIFQFPQKGGWKVWGVFTFKSFRLKYFKIALYTIIFV